MIINWSSEICVIKIVYLPVSLLQVIGDLAKFYRVEKRNIFIVIFGQSQPALVASSRRNIPRIYSSEFNAYIIFRSIFNKKLLECVYPYPTFPYGSLPFEIELNL